jgi:hypothetical protein
MDVTIARIILASLYLEAPGVGRNYTRIVELLQPLSRNGDIYALAKLGQLYESGQGVQRNYGLAANAYRKAIAHEVPSGGESAEGKELVRMTSQAQLEATNNLGQLYLRGSGVKVDFKRAAALFSTAARKGYVDAQVNLARMFLLGQGVEQSKDQALGLLNQAASRGSEEAHHELGLLYFGDGKKPDNLAMAYIHLTLAKSLGAKVNPEQLGRVKRMLAPNQRMVLDKHIASLREQMPD